MTVAQTVSDKVSLEILALLVGLSVLGAMSLFIGDYEE